MNPTDGVPVARIAGDPTPQDVNGHLLHLPAERSPSAHGHDERSLPDYLDTHRQLAVERAADRAARRSAMRAADGRALATRRLTDDHFAHPGPARLNHLYDSLAERVDGDILRGAGCHRRVPRTIRIVPLLVAFMDAVVLYLFWQDIFGFDLEHLDRATLPWFVSALMMAVLGTGVAYTWLALTGAQLRTYRTPLGEIEWGTTGATTRIMIGVGGLVLTALAVLMYVRVVSEIDSGSPIVGVATVVGVAFAALAAVANLVVVAVHALDGSTTAAELRRAGRLLRRREREWHRIR